MAAGKLGQGRRARLFRHDLADRCQVLNFELPTGLAQFEAAEQNFISGFGQFVFGVVQRCLRIQNVNIDANAYLVA